MLHKQLCQKTTKQLKIAYELIQCINKKSFSNIRKTWIIACHENEIKNRNDFKTLDYYGESIIIYNINNEFLAYKNVKFIEGQN